MRGRSKLAARLLPSSPYLRVRSTSMRLAVGDLLLVGTPGFEDGEVLRVVGASRRSFIVDRGFGGTTAQPHPKGSQVDVLARVITEESK